VHCADAYLQFLSQDVDTRDPRSCFEVARLLKAPRELVSIAQAHLFTKRQHSLTGPPGTGTTVVCVFTKNMEGILAGEACPQPGRTWASRKAIRAESKREQQFYRFARPSINTTCMLLII
jgi:hypothetical protein